MTWTQHIIRLNPRPRGIHLITDEIVAATPEIGELSVGLAHIFIQHTSASLAINENADPSVRSDVRSWLDVAVPEDWSAWTHTDEGPDDMPSHVKSILTGSFLQLPISNGRLALGTWQGVYLCEHRDRAGGRRVVVTLQGEAR
jgi:secondary thiamine-phosphate synthase enzyme